MPYILQKQAPEVPPQSQLDAFHVCKEFRLVRSAPATITVLARMSVSVPATAPAPGPVFTKTTVSESMPVQAPALFQHPGYARRADTPEP